MPIYEFYCCDCHTIFNFLARKIDAGRRPACPRCGRPDLERKVSLFAVSKGRSEGPAESEMPDLDESKMEQALASLEREAGGLDEDDPRAMARLMRKLYDSAGLRLGKGVEEAIGRLEAGEDPDKIDEQMGDVLDQEDPLLAKEGGGLGRLARRLKSPAVDDTLYEL